MTEFMPISQVRAYTLPTGETVDLARMSYYIPNMPELMSAPSVDAVKVGDKVYALAMGKYRKGVVVKVGRTKVHVAYTTPGAISANDPRGVRVGIQAVAPAHVLIPAPDLTPLAEILPTVEGEPEVPAAPVQSLEFPRVNEAAREAEASTKAPYATLSILASATDVVHIVPEVTVPGLAAPDGGPVTVPVPAPKMGEDMSPLAVAGTYRVEFDRVGRSRNIPILEVEVSAAETWNTANVLAEKIHAHVSAFLASTWYTIEVDLIHGRVLIQDGRFGEGKATLIRKSA